MASFDDVHLPSHIESGALVGPQFQTNVVSMASGKEQRNAEWEQERLTANIAYGVMKKEDDRDIEDSFQQIMEFYRARRGRHRAFRFKDWSDYEASQQYLNYDPTGLKYQLVKRYGNYVRRITRPVEGTIEILMNGALSVKDTDWFLDPLGVIRVIEAHKFKGLTATFEFDVPMRFDVDVLQVNLEWANAGSISNIDLIQVTE